jgi:hypothetical protein
LSEYDIVCKRCGKKARITAEEGLLCLLCWRLTRKENKEIRLQNSLDKCFSYMNTDKVSDEEARIISEVMIELKSKEKKKVKSKKKVKLKKKK